MWYGDELILGITAVRIASYSVHGLPGHHASSQTEIPRAEDASRIGHAASPGTNVRASSNTP